MMLRRLWHRLRYGKVTAHIVVHDGIEYLVRGRVPGKPDTWRTFKVNK